MKGDISRQTFRPERHYSGVRMQQGRVQLDADWNEQVDIQSHLARTNARDVIGESGVPKGPSFSLDPAALVNDLLIAPGRFWAGGLLCELEASAVAVTGFPAGTNVVEVASTTADGRPFRPGEWVAISTAGGAPSFFRVFSVNAAGRTVTFDVADDAKTPFDGKVATLRRVASYANQPHLTAPPFADPTSTPGVRELVLPSDGLYLAYLDAWERHVTAIEDGAIREKALGGPDTATRSQVVWQLRLLRAGDLGDTVDCRAALPAAPEPGKLRARAQRVVSSDDPCIADPKAGYSRLENQLYRVEIHQGGTLKDGESTGSPITFKWSRDNGSVALPWTAASGKKLTVAAPGRDRALGLAPGQWIELSDDSRDLDGTPGTLVQIDVVSGDDVTVLSSGAISRSDYPVNPRVRRWDGQDANGLAEVGRDETVNDGFLQLESGVEVRFEDGEYRTGDHWLVPARVVTGDVEWPRDPGGDPLPRPPEGIAHQLAPVALLSWDSGAGALAVVEDCRPRFPPLTHLCAEDICVEGTPCGEGVETVQDAIDKLCAGQDLRFHNQHLHGWGVVCGLQLHCCPEEEGEPGSCGCERPGECVALEAGYAIDPTGTDVRLPERVSVPIADLIVAAGLAERGDGGNLADVQVSVVLQRDGTVAVEKYQAQSIWDRLEGTMLRDLVEECLAPLVEFFKEELLVDPDANPKPLVGPAQKRLTALVNLLVQLFNPRWGSAVFLSGLADPAAYPEGDDREDLILRTFFNKLRELLSSKTFCGMYEGVGFPPYDVLKAAAPANASRPETIFSNALDNKLRVSPNGNLLYAFGSGDVIRVFDHDKRAMIQELKFPVTGAVVQDLAFNTSGSTVFVTALMGTAKVDSAFAVASVDSAGQHKFPDSGAVVVCDVPWVSLQTSANVEGKVFAVARGPADKKGGLYVIDPAKVNLTPTAAVPFNAVGPFVVSDRDTGSAAGYACASSGTTATSTYDRVVRIDLKATGAGTTTYALPSSGDDDLCVVRDDRAQLRSLFVVVNGSQGFKQLVRLDDEDAAATPQIINLTENTTIRLAYGRQVQRVFVTYEDNYFGRILNPHTGELSEDLHPLQIGPIAVRAAKGGERWVVLNYFSRTLTSIPARWTSATGAQQVDQSVIDRDKLKAYRAAALKALIQLAGRFLQYLKDCVCDRFLVECPKDEGQKLYLGAVSFKKGKVYQICDFDRRRYVYSFPSVKYWGSLFPVLPFLKMALEKACCAVLPPLFDEIKLPSSENEASFKTSGARTGFQTVSTMDLQGKISEQLGKWISVKQVAGAWFGAKVEQAKVGPTANTVASDALVGTSAKEAELKAEALGVTVVSARTLDPVSDPLGALGAAVAPTRLKPGTPVELVTDAAGTVKFVRPVQGGAADVAALAAIRKQQQEVLARASSAEERASTLDGELEVMKLESLDREAKLTRLSNRLNDVVEESERRGKEISELRSTVNDLRKANEEALATQRKELARMTKDLTALRDRLPPR